MNIFDPSQFSNDCAPIYSDDSIFFNLILNSNYENTKENCLLFLRNYSKRIPYTKRDIFRIIINELTLGDNSDLNIGRDESIYLIRQIIKKYSRNNIINALYDFVSLNEDENSLMNQEKNSSNYTNDFTNDRTQNSERGESKKDLQKIMNIINKKDKKKKEKKEFDKIENENSIISSGEGDFFDDDNSVDKLLKFLEKKRKSSALTKKEKKDKRPKKEQKENKSKIKKEREKIDEKISNKDNEEEEDKMNEEEMEKDDGEKKEKKEDKDNKKDKKESEELKMDKWEEKNIKKEKEKIDIKNDINGFEKEEKNKTKEKMFFKKEDNILSSIKEGNKFQRRSYKNRIRNNMNYLSPFKSFISKSISGISSPIEIIKLESAEDANGDSNNITSPIKNRRSRDKIKSSNQLDILSYMNLSKSKNSKSFKEHMNKFGNHLIKDLKDKTFIYSYRIKRYQNFKNNIILFECNNNKCMGKAEYDAEKKIFRETVEHNIPSNLHKLAFAHYNVRQNLLMDDCLGYQLFKDNNNFIKDKKVILLK